MNGSPPRLKLGLVGAGRIGQLHAAHLRRRLPEAELVFLSDPNLAAAQACAAAHGIPEIATDHRVLVAHPDIQAIVICSSTDTHAQIIDDAAAAGKHIFCEKPIAADLPAIDRALAAVRGAGVIFQVGFNRRFDPNFARIRQAVADGAIGTAHQVHIVSRDPAPPPIDYVRRSGGMFLDMTIHDFDMACFLMGDSVTEVFAMGGVRVDTAIGEAGDIDTATVLLQFAGGAVGVIENCRQAVYGYDQRAEVFGSGGSIRVDNNHPNTALLSDAQGVRRDRPLTFFMDRYIESYLEEMRAFLNAVRTHGPSPVPAEAGRVPVVMALAAQKSLREHRPVKLAEIG